MKTLVKETKTKTYLKFGDDFYATNHDWSNHALELIDIGGLHPQRLDTLKSDSGWMDIGDFQSVDNAYFAYLGILRKASEQRKEEQKLRDAALDPFWKDVDSRIGMDVCDPFIDRVRGHSFVSYDRGFVWSKTLRAVFKLRNCTGSHNYYPKDVNKVYSFGADLNDIKL